MLKIKAVKMKDLEKFKLNYHPEQRNICEHYSYTTKDDLYINELHLCVWCNNRQITAFDREGQDLLFDLIKADMVEKVVEDELNEQAQ